MTAQMIYVLNRRVELTHFTGWVVYQSSAEPITESEIQEGDVMAPASRLTCNRFAKRVYA